MSAFTDHIFADQHQRWNLPYEPASVPGYIKHVHCDGSRDHVTSYSGYENWRGMVAINRCSVKNCIINFEADEKLRANGFTVPGARP